MNILGSYIALTFGVISTSLGLSQIKIWLALRKRGVKVQTFIVDTFKTNDLDECFIVSFNYQNKEKKIKLYESDDRKKINDSIICIFDPQTETLEIDSKWNMGLKVFGPLTLGISFIWVGLSAK